MSDDIQMAQLALIHKALTMAAEDGSYDGLSQPVRSLLADALMPPQGGIAELIDNYVTEIATLRELLKTKDRIIGKIAEIADTIPGHHPSGTYNRFGHWQRNYSNDVKAIRKAVEKSSK